MADSPGFDVTLVVTDALVWGEVFRYLFQGPASAPPPLPLVGRSSAAVQARLKSLAQAPPGAGMVADIL